MIGWNKREQKENKLKGLDFKVCPCFDCTSAEFDADGCYCKKLEKLVNTKNMTECKYFQF